MKKYKVDISKAYTYGWETLKKDFWYFVGMALVVVAISSIGHSRDNEPSGWGLVGFILSTWITCGSTKLILSYYDGKKLPFGELFSQLKYFWRVLGASLLIALIVAGGLILLIVPGIYFALKYQFTIVSIIDKDLGIREAMNESSKLTQDIKIPLLWFDLASLGVIILGAIVLGVGILVAMPVVWLAHVYLYRNIR